MNKITWEESKCPFEMMVALFKVAPTQDTKVKLIFFATSCCFHLLNFLKDERSQKVVELMSQYEDTRGFRIKLAEARADALTVLQEKGIDILNENQISQEILAEIAVFHLSSFITIADALVCCARAIANNDDVNIRREYSDQAILLREMFGNPFQVHKDTVRLKLK